MMYALPFFDINLSDLTFFSPVRIYEQRPHWLGGFSYSNSALPLSNDGIYAHQPVWGRNFRGPEDHGPGRHEKVSHLT